MTLGMVDGVRFACVGLPAAPRQALAILGESGSRDARERLEDALLRSPTAVAALLDFANRVAGGGVGTVLQAIGQLGVAHAADVGIAALLRPTRAPLGRASEVRGTWDHAVATGAWSRIIAAWRGRALEGVFLGGLLHRVGRLVLLHHPAGQSDEVAVARHERAVGIATGRAWGLPAPVQACIAHHDDPERAPGFKQQVATVRLGALFAACQLSGGDVTAVRDPVLHRLGLDPADLVDLATARHEVRCFVAALS